MKQTALIWNVLRVPRLDTIGGARAPTSHPDLPMLPSEEKAPLCEEGAVAGAFPGRDIPQATVPFRPDHICVLN